MPELNLPTPGVTGGPVWASQLNAAITEINDEIETGRLSEAGLNATIAEQLVDLDPEFLESAVTDAVDAAVADLNLVEAEAYAATVDLSWSEPGAPGYVTAVVTATVGGTEPLSVPTSVTTARVVDGKIPEVLIPDVVAMDADVSAEAAARAAAVSAEAAARAAAVESVRHDAALRGRVPVMSITLDGGVDPTTKDTYISGTYAITDTDSGVLHEGGIRLRGRGNSTWARAKKPWRINFDSKTAPLGMTANQKNWALLANDFDGVKVNNAFSLDLGARMSGLEWTPEYRTVELVLNGTFRGLYQLADLVRMESGRVAGPEPSSGGDGSDGAWLMEISNKERPGSANATGGPGFATATYNVWIFYDTPEEPTVTQEAYIAGLVNAFEADLYAGLWAGWKTKGDATSFADWYLINELIRNQDSAFYSSCKLHTDDNGIIIMGPLWDQDLSLGLAWGTGGQAADSAPTGWHTRGAAWIARMWQDSSWRTLIQSRWTVLLAAIEDMGGVDAWVDRSIDAQQRAIADDNRRWSQTTYTTSEADKKKRWVHARVAWLTAQINAPINPVPATVTATV